MRAVSPREHRGALIFCVDGGGGGRKSSTRGNAKAKIKCRNHFQAPGVVGADKRSHRGRQAGEGLLGLRRRRYRGVRLCAAGRSTTAVPLLPCAHQLLLVLVMLSLDFWGRKGARPSWGCHGHTEHPSCGVPRERSRSPLTCPASRGVHGVGRWRLPGMGYGALGL